MTDLFNELMKELGEDEKNTVFFSDPDIPERDFDFPDALVLLTIDYSCDCGSRFSAPNSHLLYRYGTSIKNPDKWLDKFNELPRERKKHEVKIHACGGCFERRLFSLSDIKPKWM